MTATSNLRFDPPIHPGEILREEYLLPLDLSPGALARQLGVPRTRIERLARCETAVTSDTALRLARALGTTAQFWLNMQTAYDLTIAEKNAAGAIAGIRLIAGLGDERAA